VTRAAAAGHLSALAVAGAAVAVAGRPVIWAGALAFLGPLAVLLGWGRRDPFVRGHALAALDFNLCVALVLVLVVAGLASVDGSPGSIQLVPFLIFVNLLVALNWLLFALIGTHRAAHGLPFTYPLTPRILRRMN
jgi:uncharacterized Tic20 family protein